MTRVDAATVALDIVVPPPPPPPRSVDPGAAHAPPEAARRSAAATPSTSSRWATGARRTAPATRSPPTADILRFYASLMGDAPYPTSRWRCSRAIARRAQPGVLRRAQQPAADVAVRLAQRSGDASATSPSSSWPTKWRTSGGVRRWAGRTTTSSGSAKASRSTSPRSTPARSAATAFTASALRQPAPLGDGALGSRARSSLGYRLGHIKDEPRVFRALVYNKGAAVLHMLRRLVGDEAFFSGLRRFYAEHRFTQGRHRRPAAGDGSRERTRRSSASSSAGCSTRRCRACG